MPARIRGEVIEYEPPTLPSSASLGVCPIVRPGAAARPRGWAHCIPPGSTDGRTLKWAQIKRKKGAADAKRGQLFTKLARAITVAARDGGGDPEGNAALANAIERAKGLRMPKEKTSSARSPRTGGADAAAIESVTYEGTGPAILIECLTDTRTAADFSRADASLGEPGSVA